MTVRSITNVESQSTEAWLAGYNGSQTGSPVVSSPPTPTRPEKSPALKQEREGKSAPKLVMPDDLDVLIPEGWYIARCIYQQIGEFWGSPKLTLTFQITLGEYNGTKLECFYNLQKQKTDSGGHDLVPGKRSHYLRMLRRVFGGVLNENGMPIQPQDLVGKLFDVEVGTVSSDHQKIPLDQANHYSRIKTNIELHNEDQ